MRQHTKTQKQKCKKTKIQKYNSTNHKNAKNANKFKNYNYTNTQTQGASEEITIGAVGLGQHWSSGYITATYTLLYIMKQT